MCEDRPRAQGRRTRPRPKVEDEHDHGPLVVELLRTPLDVPAFAMTDLDGRTISSDSLKGKVVLINFWATWCGPCVVEIPDLVKLQAKYRDQLVVIGVSEDENGEALVRKFAADKQINYPLVMSTPELQALFPGVVALPTTFALDRNGKMVQKHVGLLHAEQTEALARVLAGLETDARVEHVDDCQQPERGAHRRDQERARREPGEGGRRTTARRPARAQQGVVQLRLRPDGGQVPRRRSLLPRQPSARAVDR